MNHMVVAAAVAAVVLSAGVCADTDYFTGSSPQAYNNYHYENFYDQPQASVSLWDRIFGTTRRQGLGVIGGAGPIIAVMVIVALIGFVAIAGAVYFSTLSSSGRGLENDDWEVNHSLWMDQLHQDFEDSWSNS